MSRNSSKPQNTVAPSPAPASSDKRRRRLEATATLGLLLVAAALVIPMASLFNPGLQAAMKWVYAAGALIYTVARAADLKAPGESLRVRRLRRMEFWAGIALCLGAGLWFWNAHRLGTQMGMTLGVVRDTIMFTMVGAVLQVIASWMIASRLRKEQNTPK